VITFCSDFGMADPYAAIVKGVILSVNPKAEVIDLSHQLAVHDIPRAAFFVTSACAAFPPATIHLCVVDPGVGGPRKPILLVTERGLFVGPDNGLFALIWKNSRKREVFWLRNKKYFFWGTSKTFDARDIFGPAAAYLSLGVAPEEFGPVLSQIHVLEFPAPVGPFPSRGGRRRFLGEIIYIDRFGNLVTNFSYGLVQGRSMEMRMGTRVMRGPVSHYAMIPKGKTAPILGSLGYLEIAGNASSAVELLKAKIGMKVVVTLV